MKIVSWFLAAVITLSLAFSVSADPKRIGYIVNYGTHRVVSKRYIWITI